MRLERMKKIQNLLVMFASQPQKPTVDQCHTLTCIYSGPFRHGSLNARLSSVFSAKVPLSCNQRFNLSTGCSANRAPGCFICQLHYYLICGEACKNDTCARAFPFFWRFTVPYKTIAHFCSTVQASFNRLAIR